MRKYSENNIKVPRFNEANGFYTTEARSKLMSRIKCKNTKPELKLRKFIWQLGIRYRKNVKKLPGTPDIVISKYKLIIFIDGEFWHGYNWIIKRDKIKSNREFWIPKIERNMQRDKANDEYYTSRGWKVIRFWEQEVKNEFGVCIYRIISYINEFQLYEKIDNSLQPFF